MDSESLVRAGRRALAAEGLEEFQSDSALQLTALPARKVLRLAFDAPFTYGRSGARWYEDHHALPQILSREWGVTLHTYVLDPEECELVVTYADGRRVGGELLRYDDFDPGEALEDEMDFERVKRRWPLGHLAQVLGLTRDELVGLPRSHSELLNLDGSSPRIVLADLLPAMGRPPGIKAGSGEASLSPHKGAA